MIMKIEVECKSCECSFMLSSLKYKPRESLDCPNCGQAVPSHNLKQIDDAMRLIRSIPEVFAGSSAEDGFVIRPICIDAENSDLPF